jgi:hypothetical protein
MPASRLWKRRPRLVFDRTFTASIDPTCGPRRCSCCGQRAFVPPRCPRRRLGRGWAGSFSVSRPSAGPRRQPIANLVPAAVLMESTARVPPSDTETEAKDGPRALSPVTGVHPPARIGRGKMRTGGRLLLVVGPQTVHARRPGLSVGRQGRDSCVMRHRATSLRHERKASACAYAPARVSRLVWRTSAGSGRAQRRAQAARVRLR